jgi:hypothetical protein
VFALLSHLVVLLFARLACLDTMGRMETVTILKMTSLIATTTILNLSRFFVVSLFGELYTLRKRSAGASQAIEG